MKQGNELPTCSHPKNKNSLVRDGMTQVRVALVVCSDICNVSWVWWKQRAGDYEFIDMEGRDKSYLDTEFHGNGQRMGNHRRILA